jgi:hypothetical protein
MSMKILYGVTFWIAVFLVLVGRALVFGQTQKTTPAPATAKESPVPVADPAAKILLTAQESKDLEFNQLQIENLNYKVEDLRKQIMSVKQNLDNETAELTAKFAKAHNLDLTKYRLDPQAKAFIPVPVPAGPKAVNRSK